MSNYYAGRKIMSVNSQTGRSSGFEGATRPDTWEGLHRAVCGIDEEGFSGFRFDDDGRPIGEYVPRVYYFRTSDPIKPEGGRPDNAVSLESHAVAIEVTSSFDDSLGLTPNLLQRLPADVRNSFVTGYEVAVTYYSWNGRSWVLKPDTAPQLLSFPMRSYFVDDPRTRVVDSQGRYSDASARAFDAQLSTKVGLTAGNIGNMIRASVPLQPGEAPDTITPLVGAFGVAEVRYDSGSDSLVTENF